MITFVTHHLFCLVILLKTRGQKMEAHETKCSTYPYEPLFYSYGGGEPLNYVKNTLGYHHNLCQSPFVNSSSFKSEGMWWWRGGVILYAAAPQYRHMYGWHALVELSDWTGPSISAVTVIYRGNGVLSCPVLSCLLYWWVWSGTKAMVHNETVLHCLLPSLTL